MNFAFAISCLFFIKRNCYRFITIFCSLLFISSCSVQPHPITAVENHQRVQDDLAHLFAKQEKIIKPLTLYDAMARAVRYNLDFRLKKFETIVAFNEFSLAKYKMLPQMLADAGYTTRTNQQAASSLSLSLGTPSFGASTSEDRTRRVADLNFSWNILDFGASYFSAKQKADLYLAGVQRERKIIQNIIRDVRYAYWKALAAQRLLRDIRPLRAEIEHALRQSKTIENTKTKSPLEALQYQKTLLEILHKISSLERDLYTAKAELAALINAESGDNFSLDESSVTLSALPQNFPMKIRLLEKIAIYDRPELQEEMYRNRIDYNEISKARLSMLPGLKFDVGDDYDSNRFLLNQRWATASMKLTWNLLDFISGPAAIAKAKNSKKVTYLRRLATSITVLTQVDVAYLRYQQTKDALQIAGRLREVDAKIYRQLQQEVQARKTSPLELIRAKADYIFSKLRCDLAYAEFQNSAGMLLNSIGFDPLKQIDGMETMSQLSRALRNRLAQTNVDHNFMRFIEKLPITNVIVNNTKI